MMNAETRGRFPRVLCMGRVSVSKSGNNVIPSLSGMWWDSQYGIGDKLSVSRLKEGVYKITFSQTNIPSGSFVMVTGVGRILGSESNTKDNAIKATLVEQTDTSITVETADDNSSNDGSFNFIIYGPNWDYNFANPA
jgi:hypothetical protein